jgi:riboflavin kinase/FMN adenylyltransferase
MQIFNTLEEYKSKSEPIILTIGNFDGVHLGHKKVIASVVEEARKRNYTAVLITFRNHPLEVLEKNKTIKVICTPRQKEKLIEELGIDILFSLSFTKKFSQQDAETFLSDLKKHLNYQKIILGYDARIGKEREGDREKIEELAWKMHFEVEHVDPFKLEGARVHSSEIRKAIFEGDFENIQRYLGRPYSIISNVISGSKKGSALGYPTANLDVSKLCLPPLGVYLVKVQFNDTLRWGIANLGFAPTIRESVNPLLEVHVFDLTEDIYGKELEVFFVHFLRPEIKFDTIENLKNQIAADIQQAKIKIMLKEKLR